MVTVMQERRGRAGVGERRKRAGMGRDGFSLIEVMMAVLILTVGLLGLAGTTGFVVRQTRLADITTERAIARQSVVEQIRAQDLADVTAGTAIVGEFQVQWTITETDALYKTIEVVTSGPGLQTDGGAPRLVSSVSDTFTFQMIDLRP